MVAGCFDDVGMAARHYARLQQSVQHQVLDDWILLLKRAVQTLRRLETLRPGDEGCRRLVTCICGATSAGPAHHALAVQE